MTDMISDGAAQAHQGCCTGGKRRSREDGAEGVTKSSWRGLRMKETEGENESEMSGGEGQMGKERC